MSSGAKVSGYQFHLKGAKFPAKALTQGIDAPAQLGPSRNTVSEPGSELLHATGRFTHL